MDKIPLIIFGSDEIAEVAYYYFNSHSNYKVIAFTLDREYIGNSFFCKLPVIPFDEVVIKYPVGKVSFFVAIGYSNLNTLRKEKYLQIKNMGYELASFISTKSCILNSYVFGDNCFILEDNTIQPFVKIGDNVTLWSGNHIGHHSIIKSHSFISSHVVVSGGVEVGEQCFIGVNATLKDHIKIGDRCIIGASALIMKDSEPDGIYIAAGSERSKVPSFKVKKF